MGKGAERIYRGRLGSSPGAEVLRYDDNDVLIHDSDQVEEGYLEDDGSIVLSWNQVREFTKVVHESSATEDETHVRHIEVGKEWNLGRDQNGRFATFERNMEPEFYFSADDEEETCLLTMEQAQNLFNYLAEAGYYDMWGIEA